MPLNPSPAQSETSRLNGARSRGPATAAGRAVLARAAMRHGLGGAFSVMPGEQVEEYEALLAGVLAAVGAAGRAVAEELAQATWRLGRWRRLAAGQSGSACGASPATLVRYRARLVGQWRRVSARLEALHASPELHKLPSEPEISFEINAHASPELTSPQHAEPERAKLRNEPRPQHASPEHRILPNESRTRHAEPEDANLRNKPSPAHAEPERPRPMNRHQRRRAAKLGLGHHRRAA
jgi:hypothetical protein